jgi:hypothetical protein
MATRLAGFDAVGTQPAHGGRFAEMNALRHGWHYIGCVDAGHARNRHAIRNPSVPLILCCTSSACAMERAIEEEVIVDAGGNPRVREMTIVEVA